MTESELTIILGFYYLKKGRNLVNFAKQFNNYFQTDVSKETILYELGIFENISPSKNAVFFKADNLYYELWDKYISEDGIQILKEKYKRFLEGKSILQILYDNPAIPNIDELEKASTVIHDIPIVKPIFANSKEINGFKRNRNVVANALASANYLCEANCNTELFYRKDGWSTYTEAHHLIPLKYQNRFQYSLDVEANVVSLCPNCHRLLHYGMDIKNLLSKLYIQRLERLKECKIDIDFEDLLEMYK